MLAWSHIMQLEYTKLIVEADYMGQLKQGQWLWICNNLNLHQTIRHERQGVAISGSQYRGRVRRHALIY